MATRSRAAAHTSPSRETRRSTAAGLLQLACAILVAAACVCNATEAVAQTTGDVSVEVVSGDTYQQLALRDGSMLFGQVTAFTETQVTFRTLSGAIVTVARADIVSLHVTRGNVRRGEFQVADSNRTRLFFGPTGRSLSKGDGYLGVYEFLLPFVQVGITDRVSFGGGTPLFFADKSSHPVWITPKVQVYRGDGAEAAVGVMHFLNVDEDNGWGIAYGVATFGSDDNAVTVGAGWGYDDFDDDDGDSSGRAIAMIGAEHRLTRRTKLLTENYVFDGGALVMVGMRFLGDHLSADLGLVAPVGVDEVIVFPVVNFVWTFGDHR